MRFMYEILAASVPQIGDDRTYRQYLSNSRPEVFLLIGGACVVFLIWLIARRRRPFPPPVQNDVDGKTRDQ
jgi:hypothetical protein